MQKPPKPVFKKISYDEPVSFFKDSILLGNMPDIIDWLLPLLPRFDSVQLIYRASTHGGENSKFHEYCDDLGPTFVIAKSKAGKIFGGYSSVSWHSGFGDYKVDTEALIFSTDMMQIFRPTKVSCAIFCDSGYGPSFGC